MLESARGADFEAWARKIIVAVLHPSRQANHALIEVNVRMTVTVGFPLFEQQQRAIIRRQDTHSILPGIKISTLVLVGDGDVVTPPKLSEEIAAAVAGSELVVIPECGHASTIERPQLVSAALLKWAAR